mmetsp:Transcript_71228/g.225122  ORF Transcript_71228/g.225122 Transcript_71228/m.225122 type:complete len:140 (+) Transcript_71228:91-510(+)
MKLLEVNSGLLTNFEVLEVVRARGADPEQPVATSLSPVQLQTASASETKALQFLTQSPVGGYTREGVRSFLDAIEVLQLTKAEKLQLINLRPTSAVEVHLVVEDCEERLKPEQVDNLIELVSEHLAQRAEEGGEEDGEQ